MFLKCVCSKYNTNKKTVPVQSCTVSRRACVRMCVRACVRAFYTYMLNDELIRVFTRINTQNLVFTDGRVLIYLLKDHIEVMPVSKIKEFV